MRQINIFHKGIVSDLDPSLRSNDTWDFPTQNVRIINHQQQGLVISNIGGNELSFTLSEGFKAVGSCEYKGIIFIASYNEETEQGEIGTFPSIPQRTSTGFTRDYRPLYNLIHIGAPRPEEMRSKRLKFSLDHNVDMFARESYDGTANLYMCDYYHHNKVVNCGFTFDGIYLNRSYNESTLETEIMQITNSSKHPIVDVDTVNEGGSLMPGNYFLFIRYVTESFDRTHFLYEIGPIQIHQGSDMITIEGQVDNGVLNTGKKIILDITNLDTAFTYFEIGVIRYSGEHGNDVFTEYYLIDKYYDIQSSTTTIVIYGNEQKNFLSYEEIIKPPINETICLSHMQEANYYWGVNWKEAYYDKEAFALLALTIDPLYKTRYSDDVYANEYVNYANGTSLDIIEQHKDYKNTLANTSFIRGEIYPIGIVFVMSGGRETPAFPIKGKDCYLSGGPHPTNSLGLFRFPEYQYELDSDNAINDVRHIMGLSFDLTDFYNTINSDLDTYGEIEGFYIVRGERIPNMVYQGYINKCYNKINHSAARVHWDPGISLAGEDIYFNEAYGVAPTEYNPSEKESLYIPLFGGWMPINLGLNNPIDYDPIVITEGYGLSQGVKKIAMFSFDHMFELSDKIGDESELYLKTIFEISNITSFATTNSDTSPTTYHYEIKTGSPLLTVPNSNNIKVIVSNVGKAQWKAKRQFTGYFGDNYVDITRDAFYHATYGFTNISISNRSIRTARYIGLTYDDQDDAVVTNAIGKLLLFNTAVEYWDNTESNFNIRNIDYRKITPYNKIDHTNTTIDTYKGDAFIQRGWYRQQRHAHIPDEWQGGDPGTDIIYAHGVLVSMLTENIINLAMRCDVSWETDVDNGVYTYFPKCLDRGYTNFSIYKWTVWNTDTDSNEEAFYINSGYNKILGGKPFLGYDSTYPETSNIKGTRVRHSAAYVPGAYFDGYRLFDEANYIDVDISSGHIKEIGVQQGNIITIHEDGIHRLFTKDQRSEIEIDAGKLVVGIGSILSNQTQKIAEYGTQHKWSVIETESGIYGWDFKRSIVWRVVGERSGFGNIYNQVQNLTLLHNVVGYTKQLTTKFDNFTDIVNTLGDNPANELGIYSSYNRRYNEIYFTLLYNERKKPERITLAFSELINSFVGEMSFHPVHAFNIYDDYYSSIDGNSFYIHDKKHIGTLYGQIYDSVVSTIVNGSASARGALIESKVFLSISVEMPQEELKRVDFYTQYQSSSVYPFIDADKFWVNPEYLGNRWHIPINMQVSADEQQWLTSSDMNGTYLKIMLTYNGDKSIFIKNIMTDFNITQF